MKTIWVGRKKEKKHPNRNYLVAILISVKFYFLQEKKNPTTHFSELYLYIWICCNVYSFFIVFYSGPNRGHYIAIVKSHDFWLLFDDDIVEVSFVWYWIFFSYLSEYLHPYLLLDDIQDCHANACSKWARTVSAELHLSISLYNNLNCFAFYIS